MIYNVWQEKIWTCWLSAFHVFYIPFLNTVTPDFFLTCAICLAYSSFKAMVFYTVMGFLCVRKFLLSAKMEDPFFISQWAFQTVIYTKNSNSQVLVHKACVLISLELEHLRFLFFLLQLENSCWQQLFLFFPCGSVPTKIICKLTFTRVLLCLLVQHQGKTVFCLLLMFPILN